MTAARERESREEVLVLDLPIKGLLTETMQIRPSSQKVFTYEWQDSNAALLHNNSKCPLASPICSVSGLNALIGFMRSIVAECGLGL